MWKNWDYAGAQNVYQIGIGQQYETSSTGAPGYVDEYVDINPNYTFDSRDGFDHAVHHIYLTVSGASNLRFKGVRVRYSRQISPAPGTATFGDVPVGSFGFKQVEALVASGITAGCGPTNFCPNATLTRVQMAIFLAKALGLHWDD